MSLPYLDQLVRFFTAGGLVLGILWLTLVVLTVVLLVLMHTRWGQSRALRKCMFLSLAIHLWLAGLSATVRPIPAPTTLESGHDLIVHIAPPDEPHDKPNDPTQQTPTDEKPWEQLADKAPVSPQLTEPERRPTPTPHPTERKSQAENPRLPGDPSLDHLPLARAAQPQPKPIPLPAKLRSEPQAGTQTVTPPAAQRRDPQPPVGPVPVEPQRPTDPAAATLARKTNGASLPSVLLTQPGPLPKPKLTRVTPEPSPMQASPADPGSNRSPKAAELQTAQANTPAEVDKAYDKAATSGRLWSASALPGSLAASGPPPGDGPTTVLAALPVANLKRHGNQPEKYEVPEAYKLRVALNRSEAAERRGASARSEQAVRSALDWLAQAQTNAGNWDPIAYDAGRETRVAGRDRGGAGRDAQTGTTGLALLAFLAAGHTHHEGPYRDNVRRGLEYLLQIQGRDGNLGGPAKVYELMYCHAMASFALTEALGMSGDERLLEPARRAIGYTLKAQNATTGGWRYQPGDPGDTSQLGWQYMALKSAELAGLQIPDSARRGVMQFLQEVSSGKHGGNASYRRGEAPSRPMTAEAIVCWQLLGMQREHPAADEAAQYLLGELPGQGTDNLYYWYYATLALYQLQGDAWNQWNQALQTRLVKTQRSEPPLAGSWDPDPLWGSYGGRIYSTAMSALCLEVYYRFLPLYREIKE